MAKEKDHQVEMQTAFAYSMVRLFSACATVTVICFFFFVCVQVEYTGTVWPQFRGDMRIGENTSVSGDFTIFSPVYASSDRNNGIYIFIGKSMKAELIGAAYPDLFCYTFQKCNVNI